MKQRTLIGAVTAIALTMAVAAVAIASLSATGSGIPAAAQAVSRDEGNEHESGHSSGSKGHGPPSWAHAKDTSDKSWKSAWRGMTPAEHKQTMSKLVADHASGMRSWRRCVSLGNTDCERPLPPGLAKKQLSG